MDDLLRQLNVFPSVNTLGSIQEPEELRILMASFDIVVKSYDDIVSASCLPSRQDAAHPERIYYFFPLLSLLERNAFDAVAHNVWEYLGDLR